MKQQLFRKFSWYCTSTQRKT